MVERKDDGLDVHALLLLCRGAAGYSRKGRSKYPQNVHRATKRMRKRPRIRRKGCVKNFLSRFASTSLGSATRTDPPKKNIAHTRFTSTRDMHEPYDFDEYDEGSSDPDSDDISEDEGYTRSATYGNPVPMGGGIDDYSAMRKREAASAHSYATTAPPQPHKRRLDQMAVQHPQRSVGAARTGGGCAVESGSCYRQPQPAPAAGQRLQTPRPGTLSGAQRPNVRFPATDKEAVAALTDKAHRGILAVMFMPGCGGCTSYMTHHAEALHQQYPHVLFAYMDVTNKALRTYVDKLKVTSVPTFAFVKNGRAYEQVVGYHEDAIRRLLSSM
jgi:hypothetical protein